MTWRQSTVRSRELGRRLQAAQEQAGLSTEYLAAEMSWLPSQVARSMTGQRPITATDAATLLELCGVDAEARGEIVQLCEPDLDAALRLPAAEAWSVYLAEAATAFHLFEFQPRIVPWLAQTPEYARALVTLRTAALEIDRETAARTALASVLTRSKVEVVVHESALRIPLQSDQVMSDQLHHLLWLSERPNIGVHVLASDISRHDGFSLLRFPGYDPVVHREKLRTGLLTSTRSDVQVYRSTANHLTAAALPEQHSRELLKSTMAELYWPN